MPGPSLFPEQGGVAFICRGVLGRLQSQVKAGAAVLVGFSEECQDPAPSTEAAERPTCSKERQELLAIGTVLAFPCPAVPPGTLVPPCRLGVS